MNRRAALQEALVGGGAGLLVVGIYIALRSLGDPHADWLSFAGALIGSAVTVAGSVFLFHWQRDAERREERDLLLELLADVDAATRPFELANEGALRAQYQRSAGDQVAEVKAAIGRVHTFMQSVRPRTARMMRTFAALEQLNFHDADMDMWVQSMAMYPKDTDMGGLSNRASELRQAIDRARKILQGIEPSRKSSAKLGVKA